MSLAVDKKLLMVDKKSLVVDIKSLVIDKNLLAVDKLLAYDEIQAFKLKFQQIKMLFPDIKIHLFRGAKYPPKWTASNPCTQEFSVPNGKLHFSCLKLNVFCVFLWAFNENNSGIFAGQVRIFSGISQVLVVRKKKGQFAAIFQAIIQIKYRVPKSNISKNN